MDVMNDPFAVLKDALECVFHCEPMRNGKYIYPEIQQLKISLDNAQINNKKSFIDLSKAIKTVLPRIAKYLENGHIDFNSIKDPIDSIAKKFDLPLINWDAHFAKYSLRFSFSDKSKDLELLPWLEATSGSTGMEHDIQAQVRILLEYREHYGFSQKLSAHLEKDPDFLFRCIMHSEKNFSQISQTRLILYLTDQQLAEAIIKHLPHLVPKHKNPAQQAEKLVDGLNKTLSNGRSVSTILRNTEAKLILDNSELLQLYQQTIENNQGAFENPPSEEGGAKPGP
jgi:hypothetical protein